MKKNILIKAAILVAWLTINTPLLAQDRPPTKMIIKEDLILLIIAVFLTFPLVMLARTVIAAAKNKMENEKKDEEKSKNINKVIVSILFLFTTAIANAQPTLVEVAKQPNYLVSFFEAFSVTTWILIFTIIVELIVIIFFAIKTVSFLQAPIEQKAVTEGVAVATKNKWKQWVINKWAKLNNFKPIEKEADIDTGHSYDGIRELDNPAPGWFKAAFLLSIIFAIIYLYRFHVAKSTPLQIEEYNITMAEAEKEHQEYLKKAGDQVDENTITLLTGEDITAGKSIFSSNCAVCHGKEAEGVNAPNLTDKFWIHGGGLKEVFKSIKYGWQDKGMKSWKDDLKPKEIAQVASYLKSISNTNIKSARAPEGAEFIENNTTNVIDSTKK